MRIARIQTFLFMFVISGIACANEIVGNRAFSDKELESRINFALPDDSLSGKIVDFYHKAGYFDARVVRISRDSRNEKVVEIDEGRAAIIRIIHIEIVRNDSSLIFDDLIAAFSGKTASGEILNSFASDYISSLSEKGYPFANGMWREFSLDSSSQIEATFWVNPGPQTHIRTIKYRGVKRTRREMLDRTIRLKAGTVYSESRISECQKTLDQLPYVEIAAPLEILPLGDGDSSDIVFHLRELPSTKFDGAAGLATIGRKTSFLGRLDLEFGDILGTGRSFGLFWNRKDRFSRELRISYLEPFVLRSSLDLLLSAFQTDRDTTYIKTGASIGLRHNFQNGLSGGIYFTVERTAPESGNSVANSLGRSLRTEFDYDRVDRNENPISGYGLSTGVDYRTRTNDSDSLDLPTRLTSASAEIRHFLKVSRQFVSATRLSAWGIISSDGNTPADELRFLGGFDNLRGYAENSVPAYRYLLATVEPRIITGKYSRAYLFFDMAEVNGSQSETNKYQFYPGYGVGFIAPSTLGQFKLEIGWGKTGFPGDAIINFGLAGRF